jgi:Ca2+-binding RTX toxin-like protein
MSLTRKIRRLQKKSEEVATKKHRRKVLFEPLEPRVLLSADLKVAMGEGPNDLTLRLDDVTQELQVVNNADQSVVQSQLLADTGAVIIEGSDLSDKLTVDLGTPFSVPIYYSDAYEGDNDALSVTGADSTWNIIGKDSGHVGDIEFSGIENLLGAADNEDTFVFDAAGSISGVVDGGAGGYDSLILADGTFNVVTFTVVDGDTGTVDRDGNVFTFTGLEPAIDNTAGDKVVTDPTSGAADITISGSGGGITVSAPTFPESFVFTIPGTVTVNAGPGDDTITIQSLGTYANTLTVNGQADTDKLIVSQNVDMTLTNSGVTIGLLSPIIPLSSIELAELTGGSSANNLDASGFSGNVTLNGLGGSDTLTGGTGNDTLSGGTGNDTLTGGGGTDSLTGGADNDRYVFGNAWGTDTVTEAASGGIDTLDFTAVTTALTVNPLNTIFTTTGGSLTQANPERAEEIDATLPVGAITAIEGFLDNLLLYAGKLQNGAEGFGQLFNQLPFIEGSADGSIAKLTGLTGAITDFVTKAKATLGAQTTLSAVATALDGITAPGAPFDVWSLDVTTSYRGSDAAASDATGSLELLLDFKMLAAINDQTFKIDLGEEGASLGVNLDADISVDATLDADFSIGISTGAPLEVFLVPGGTITLAIDAVADLNGTAMHLGFLDLEFVNPSTIKLDGQVEIAFADDATKLDQRIDLAAVLAVGAPTIGDVTNVTVSDPDLSDPYLQVSATVKVASGVLAGGTDLNNATIAFAMGLSAADPFGTATAASGPKITTLTAALPGPVTLNLLNFGNVSPTEVMGMLGGVLDTLTALASSQFMQVVIPYSGKTVGEILDYGKSFKEDVLDPLFKSGDFLKPDLNNDGAVSLPFFDNDHNGVINAADAALAELKIGSIQELVGALEKSLGIPGLKANFNLGELTFTIDFFRAFGLGDGDVKTTTQGDDPLNIDEVQSLAYTQATVDAFRLAFRDSTGSLKITNPIAAKDATPAHLPLTSPAMQAAIDTAVEGLDPSFSGKVIVAGGAVADGERTFTITFDNSLGNVKQLGFAGELPLNFGASLGDFLSFDTSGSFGMAGILDTGLTFGIDLNPDTAIQIIPPVFAPSTVQVTTQTQGKPAGPSTNEVVKVRIVEAVGDTYQLAFRATPGTGLFTLIGAPITVDATPIGELQAAFTAALGGNAPSVALDPDGDPRHLIVTFNAGTNAAKDVELVGIREAGILSAAASFDLSLYNQPAIGIETVTNGSGSVNEVQKVHLLNATGGGFTLTLKDPNINGGVEQTTAPITFNPGDLDAVMAAINTALDGFIDIEVDVSRVGSVFAIAFTTPLHTNVAALTANAKGLVNNTALGSITVNVARDTANTSPADLAADVQKTVDQALYNANLTIGFNPAVAYSPGFYSTGAITAGTPFTAAKSPFNGGAPPSDLAYTVILPSHISVATTTPGVLNTTAEVQRIDIDAKGGTFTLSNGVLTTAALAYNAAPTNVKAALEAIYGVGKVQVAQTIGNLDLDSLNEVRYTVTFDNTLGDVAQLVADGTKLEAHTVTGQVRAAKAQTLGLGAAIQAAVNASLSSTAVTIAVGTDAGKLTITPTNSDLELRVKSAIQVNAGGGRISLDAPLVKTSFSTLEPAVEVARRLQISVDYSDPAFQEMAIASAPTRFDGKITDAIDLTLKVNSTDVHVTLASGVTAANTNLDQLVGQLQTAVNTALGLAGFTAGDVIVKRVAVNPDDPSSAKGNRFVFEGKSGVVTTLSAFIPDSATNGAITELGFPAGQSDTKRSKASSFFLEDVSFGGNFGLFENEIKATASLGLLAVTADMTGTVDLLTGKFFGADVDFDLINPVDSTSRITVDQIINAINDKKFLFQAGEAGGTFADPATGFIDGTVAGGLGLTLALKPDGAISGLPVSLGSIAISAQSPNWLLSPPTLTNPFAFAKTDQSLGGLGVAVSTTGLASPSGVLSKDMVFVLSQTIGINTFETPVVVRAIDTVGNLNAADLDADIQAAVNKAVARLQHLVDRVPLTKTVGTVDVAVSGSNVTFATLAANDAAAVNLRGLFVDIDFTKPAGLDELFDSLKNLSFDDIIAVLQLVVGMLQNLDGSSDGSPLADVFDFNIPVIDRSIGDLVNLSGDFLKFVQDLTANPAGSLQSLETRLHSLLGLPAGPSILSLDTGTKTLYFDFGFSSSKSTIRPFNLDLDSLGLGIFSQLVGLSASGNLGVQAKIDFDMKLGLDLEGSDKAFFIDVANTSLSASASAFGNNLEFEAALGPVGVFVIGGSANLAGTFDVNLLDKGASEIDGRLILAGFDGNVVTSDLGSLLSFLDTNISGTAEVVLPMFYGLKSSPAPMGDSSATQSFTPPTHFTGGDSLKGNELGLFVNLLEIFDGAGDGDDGFELRMPAFDLGNLSLPSLFTLLSDPSVIVKGLNTVLKEIQGVLQGELFGFELPLIGDALKDNPVATLVENFRLNFLQPFADMLSESNLNLDGLLGVVEGVIDDVFSSIPGMGDILQTVIDGTHHIYKFLDANGNVVPALDAKALQFDFDLGGMITKTLANLNLNVPIPILSLKGQMSPTVEVAWNLHFGFGIDLDKGFYFVSKYDDPDVSGTDNPEMTFDLTLDLGSTVTPAEIEANLAILKLLLTDGVDLDKSGFIDNDEYTKLFLNASLDIRDLRGGVTGGDGKLTIPELISQSPRDTFVFDIAGGARLLAHGELSFGGLDSAGGLSLSSILPSISTDIVLNFDISYNTLTGLDVHAPELVLANISLDLGDFIGGFAGDLLNTVGDILDPMAWLIGPDGLLNFRIPLISDLVGETVRIRDLINIFDPENGPKVNKFLDFVEVLYFLTDLVDDAAGAGVLNFGDFVLFKNDPGSSFFDDFSTFIDKPFALGGLGAFGGDLRKAPNLNNLTLPAVDPADFSAQPSTTQSFTAGVTKPGSIDFPILKPETIFGLLLGKPATIFTIELPELGFEFMYRQVIPIIGPLAATFAGKIGGKLDMGFGYDTLGITQFIATENPAYLLNGFFLNDVDPATGFDRPEATFSAEIAVGAALSLGIATIGVEGGIGADIFFNLNDPDQDTKVRFAEMASNIVANDGNPLAMFDVSGLVSFFLRAYIEVLFFEASFEFARIELFSFDIPFERPGVLASQQGSTLTLNIGPNASARIQGDTSDGNEEIHVKTIADGTVVVWSDQFNVLEGVAATNPFTGVSKIIANGGAGVDIIDLTGVNGSVTAEIHGGDGNDRITGGGGVDEIFGDDGNDIILGGLGADVIRGGLGDDELYGEGGIDELYGEEGKDKLDGGTDDDTLAGGLGNDEFTRSAGNDTINLGDAGSIDIILGGGGTPTLDLSDKTVPVTVFVKDDRILVGFGKQSTSTATILTTPFAFTNLATLDAAFGAAFEHVIGVTDASDVSKIIGTSEADIFHVQKTTSALILDGGTEADIYNFYADPSGAKPITVTVNDVGENLKDENVIQVIGSSGVDEIVVTGKAVDGGTITLDTGATQVITYKAPSSDPADFTDQLIIKVFGNGDADLINIESTFVTVPVRVEGNAGNDVITVGGNTTLNDLKSFLNANANDGFGFGPLVIVGGAGHDTVIVDDSGDVTNAENEGSITAFREKREGISGLVEVGVVSGLGMKMTVPLELGGVKVIDGHVELEEVEVVDVRMGTGDDVFVVGGALNLDNTNPHGGTWEALTLTDAQVPKTRLFNPDTLFGISQNAYTISGQTIVQGGSGKDDIRVLRTQALPGQQTEVSSIVTALETHPGDRNAMPPESEVVRLDIRADSGYFVLEFADQNLDATDPSNDDTVPGAEQTVVLPYNLTANQLKDALKALRLVGGDFIDSVTAGPLGPGVVRSYTITFSPQLDNLPNLRALDTKLLVAGEGNDDEISVQSIDQPTYILGGSVLQSDTPAFDDDDQDILNVNVQIGINGPELASAPDGLDEIPPAKAVANGVNDQLTVDGGPEGDKYFVYLFGGTADSQINLFDSGGTTDDAAFIFGTEAADMFLLRAAVANDGLAFVAMIKPPQVPVLDLPTTHVERVNYRGSLDSMKIFALEGDDAFGIDDTRLDMEIYGGEGEDFFQIGQLYKSQRNAAAGVAFADVFATIETTRGYLSNGISNAMKIFGGEDNDEFVVYHNLAPLALFGNDGDDSFLIRAFALVGSQEDLRERTDVSGDAGADLIMYAVNAPVNIDGGDGFDTVIVIGTEFNDDFVITEDGIFGAGLNIQFVRIEVVEVDGDAGDDRFFILGTSAGVLTKITGSLGSDTFFGNGPTPDVVSNDLLGHSGLISHTVDSTLLPDASDYSGIKVVGIAANVADDDEPAVRITSSDGTSIVSQVDPLATDHYTVVLTRKPENKTKVIVTSRAPAGVKFTGASDGVLGTDGDSIAFTFTETTWNTPQTAYFTAYQTGSAEIKVGNDGGNGENAKQTLAIQGTEGSFKLKSSDADLGLWTTGLISFDIRGDGKTTDGPDAGTLNREQELDKLRDDIQAAINLSSSKTVTIQRVRTTFFIEFAGTAAIAGTIDALALDSVAITFNDIVGTADGFITHDVTLETGAPKDSINNLFVQGKVAQQRDGKVDVIVDTEGGGGTNEVQILKFDASDGNFKIKLGDQISEEMLFIPLDPLKVRASIDNAINAFTGIDAVVTKIGAPGDYSYKVEFVGASADINVATLEVEASNLTRGERTLNIVGGLPDFVYDPDGDGIILEAQEQNLLRGATVKVVAGAGIGQTRLVIANTANSITVANPWIEALNETSRIEILRYEGVVLPATLVQIVGDDGNAIDLRETGGGTVAFEAPEVHGFGGTPPILGATDTDGLGLVDTVMVALTSKPGSPVAVTLDSDDAFGNQQLFFAIEGPVGTFTVVESLTFTVGNWDDAQTVYVFGYDDIFTEGFHKAVLTMTATGGGYSDVKNSVVVDIADNEVALAMVLESAHSTDVVETGNFFNTGVVPANDVDSDNAANDTYQIVLSRAPKGGETVTVNLSADPTRTQRGAGLLGIRAFDPEVVLSSLALNFNTVDWFTPQTVTVTARPDTKVEGDDSKSFAKMFDQANTIEGPLVITGGISEDRSADLEREPIYLPGETNFKPSIGTVQAVPVGVDGSFSLTIDLNEVIKGETILDTRVEGGTQGVLTVTTNTNGDPFALPAAIHEVQLLTVDAVSGTFRLTFDGTNFSSDIAYNPANPDAVATAIETALNAIPGPPTVTVKAAGTAFIITFADHVNHAPIQFANSANTLGENDLIRVGTDVYANPITPKDEILTVFGNGGNFTLSVDSGVTKTAPIVFSPDDPAVNQAKLIENALNAILVGNSVDVSGSGSTYLVTFASAPSTALGVYDGALRVDEVQTLTLNASLGTFKLTLDGTLGNTTGLLDADVTAAELKTALESLADVSGVTVIKDAVDPFYTIIFTGPGGENVNQLDIVDSTLERTVKEALETNLDIAITKPEDLKDFTTEITRGDAKNKFRILIGGSDPDASLDSMLTTLDISRPWEAGLTDKVPSLLPGHSEYTIEKTNPNLLVDENEETDFFFLNDTDNVTSFSQLPTAELLVTADHLSGLGMGGTQVIGGRLTVEGGIEYTGLEELIINLGSGDNRVIIEDTQPGATTINAGEGKDQFFVHKVSGHTFLNAGAGADTINVFDGSMLTNNHLVSGVNALLTVTGDVPQAIALTLGKGSKPDPVALIGGVDEIQQITVDATGGKFKAGFIVGGMRYFTDPLDYNVSAAGLQAALQQVVKAAFGADGAVDDPVDLDSGTLDVKVTRGGNVYRITFTDQMGQQDVPLLEINDLGLTMETGATLGDVLNIDNSADTADTQAVLTQTSLTGLGMGDLGTPGTTFNEIQTLRLDATGGTFKLGIDGTTIVSAGPALGFDINAAALDAVLEDMYLKYINGIREAAGEPPLTSADTAGGLVEVAKNDDVYVIRFVGLLSNVDVAQLKVREAALSRIDELPGGGTATVTTNLAETATRLDGITAEARNEVQKLLISATGGTFTLAFPNSDTGNVTAALPYNVTRAELQLALEALPAIVPGDVLLTTIPGGFEIEFKGELSSTDVPLMIVNASALTGPATVKAQVIEKTKGLETGLNDMQIMTVNATAGTYHLELYLPAIQKTLITGSLAFDASAEEVRRALQHELARKLNGLNPDADLSRTREAFKSDFSVARIGNTFIIGFQGVTRQIDGGQGVSLLKVVGNADFNSSGGAEIVTRMDGINYYGLEKVNINFGSGTDILNVQGTSAGSFKGINADLDAVHAATNITLGNSVNGNDQVFISSNADLDSHTIKMTAGQADVFEFLTGTLDNISGNLNIDFGSGRHRLLISDEAGTVGDGTVLKPVTISDNIGVPTGTGGFDTTAAAEIQIKELAFGDITYGAKGVATSNLYDGIIYWTGSGDDTIAIDGTHGRFNGSGKPIQRTTTQLNTGLGNDHITVDLDNAGDDDFFVLNTMGVTAAHTPVSPTISASDNDTVRAAASTLPLIIFGGLGNDDIIAGQNEDVVFGDFGRVQYLDGSGKLIAVFGFGGRDDMISSQIIDPTWVISRDMNLGGNDIIEGQGDDDILVGGANTLNSPRGTDYIDGDTGDDLIFGDAVQLRRRDTQVGVLGDITNPRFETLMGQVIYSRDDVSALAQGIPSLPPGNETGQVLVDGTARDYRNQDGLPIAAWNEYVVVELYHSQTIQDGSVTGLNTSFGNDYIAGGANHDVIFGELGDDTIQGDGSIASAVGAESVIVNRITNPQSGLAPVGAVRVPDASNLTISLTETVTVPRNKLVITPSFEAATDGDDYIEGNGGNDVIFGNLGQDDIIGGNSNLFTLTTPAMRPEGADMIFGGAGTNIARNDLGDATLDNNGVIIADPMGHARDADVIAGDNANIYRLVGISGTPGAGFLQFNYDQTSTYENRGTLRIIPRAVKLLDYTPGGPDFNSAAGNDIGAADEVHGEAGDDFIYGMKGSDILFGDGQDDDLIGGYGNDWISGGTGQDGVIGDDGRIFTSRNGMVEPLNGVMVATTQALISTPGSIQQADINVTNELKKAVDLTPFSQELGWNANNDEWAGTSKHTSDDIIYGGLGSDFLHGGSGDDAISGAEAQLPFFASPVNPGNVLRYSLLKAGEFASYDEFNPLKMISGFFLNFNKDEGVFRIGGTVPKATGQQTSTYGPVRDDGADKIFGDLGNDWLVGGTGRDDIYGGWGDDLMNADDDHTTNGNLNDQPDTHPTYEDRAYGGAGRDVLIGNTGGDRLIDWVGEFNSYIVPFAPFGMGTVSRTLQPQLAEFLYALSASDGADPSRAVDTGAAAARNGEPFGELGVVRQQDFAWQAQTGAPADPQAGNIPGGSRDVLRSASFDNAVTPTGFFADSGTWTVQNSALQVTADSLGGDAVSVFHVGDQLPGYFEVQASVLAMKPTGGWNADSFIIFDYQGKSDFKFAGIDASINKLVMGHRDSTGWHVDEQAAVQGGVKADKYYNMLLAVNGLNVTLMVDNKNVFIHTYQPRVVDGYSYGLNWGMVGVGSNNARGSFDNIQVQILPPQLTFDQTEDFVGQPTLSFSGYTNGAWSVGGGVYTSTPNGATGMSLLDLGPDNLSVSSYLELNAKVNAAGRAGFVFDRYADGSFKFAVIDAPADQVIIGHYTPKSGWVSDAAVSKVIIAGTSYTLGVALKGTTVSVTLDGQTVLGYAFNAVTADGNFGLMATGGQASFDDVRVKTNDPAFRTANLTAAAAPAETIYAGSALTYDQLDDIIEEAKDRWAESLGTNIIGQAALDQVTFQIVNFGDMTLGKAIGAAVLIDLDAAGWGWFVDATPYNDVEFGLSLSDVEKMALETSPAFGRMDLLTVVTHELGHVLGFNDLDPNAGALMSGTLEAGTRRLNDSAPDSPSLVQMDRVPGGEAASMLWGAKDNKASWLEDFLVDLAGKNDNPFDPTGKIKISIPGVKGLTNKKPK